MKTAAAHGGKACSGKAEARPHGDLVTPFFVFFWGKEVLCKLQT